jgi:GNAT superfamily N-acetyltransferase
MPVHVRDAVEGDALALSRLWSDLVAHAGADPVGDRPETVAAKAIVRVPAEDLGRILVAELDGCLVGCAFLRVGLVSPLDEARVVQLSHLKVAEGAERQGVGSALVEASLTWAEQRGIDAILTAVPQSHREGNRFLARLGMSPVASLRGGSVAALRAKMPSAAAARPGGRAGKSGRSVGQVVAVRRSQRRARARRVASLSGTVSAPD